MKVPAHQFAATVASYQAIGIPVLSQSESTACFEFGPMRLHLDKVTHLSQAEIWLEFITPDAHSASGLMEQSGFVRCDQIEALPEGYSGFWVTNPASVIHLVSETE